MKNTCVALVVILFFASCADSAQGTAQSAAASSAAGEEQPIKIKKGDHVLPPRVIHSTNPTMPRGGILGTVAVQGVVGTDGRLHDTSIRRSLSPPNDIAALDVLKEWKFEPAKKDGKPVPVKTTVEVAFF
jgi:TonB family protein